MELLKRLTMAVVATAIATLPLVALGYAARPANPHATEVAAAEQESGNVMAVVALAGAGVAVLMLSGDEEETGG